MFNCFDSNVQKMFGKVVDESQALPLPQPGLIPASEWTVTNSKF